MEMEMQMKSYLKDGNVGSVVGVVTPTDSNVGVGVGVVTPNGTANHELAAQVLPSQPLPKLRIAALMIKAAHQFMEAKGSWEMNEINTTEEAIPTRYYCHKCRHVVTVHVESELSESASDREELQSFQYKQVILDMKLQGPATLTAEEVF